jgi:putative DNA primase/helicase
MANMHTRSPIAEIARALASRAEDISVALLGEPTSRSRNEYRWGKRGSLWLNRSGADRGRWYDHERGEGGDLLDLIVREHGVRLADAIRIAESDYLGNALAPMRQLVPRRPRPSAPAVTNDAETRSKIALRIWRETVPIAGTLAECYFTKKRTLDVKRLNLAHALRWHAGIRAVVALMSDPVSGKPTGIHRTFLDTDGAKIDRKMFGRQGVIRLSSDDAVTMSLGITEGIEDGLAVLLSSWWPIWVTTSAGAVAKFPILPGIESLTIFADADAPGMQAAITCRDRLRSAGLEAAIAVPRRLSV